MVENRNKYLRRLENQLYEQQTEIIEANKKIKSLNKELKKYKHKYHDINNSNIWRLTKPLRFTLDTIKRLCYSKKTDKRNSSAAALVYDEPSGYHSVYQEEEIIDINPVVKVFAFNLPQFHTIPENDEWWGKGFTEWVNTQKAVPKYDKHYEPREPHADIGYYDLSKVESVKRQAEMAKRHGLCGFCYYYYWFSGKRLLEKPVDVLLEHPEIDINFCLCWANENWTRIWDGSNNNILIEQKYLEDDAEKFVKDIRKYVCDQRYIKWDGKPIIIIYEPKALPNVKEFISEAKRVAIEIGIGEITFWITKTPRTSIFELGLFGYVDKEVEFPLRNPHPSNKEKIILEGNKEDKIYDYTKYVNRLLLEYNNSCYNLKKIRSVVLGWDNSPRRKGYSSFDNFDLFKYYEWLFTAIEETKEKYLPEDRFVFINAWNEWGEGTYLEPDKKYGYASINATTRAIGQIPFGISFKHLRNKDLQSEVFVQVHLFYSELTDEIITYLNNMPETYDCYITTDSLSKAKVIFDKFCNKCKANYIHVDLYPNRGRDVAPFLLQMNERFDKYKFFVHIHSKKSLNDGFGDEWRKYLFETLLGNKIIIKEYLETLRNVSDVGVLYPAPFKSIIKRMKWGGDYLLLASLMQKIGVPFTVAEEIPPIFPAGDMFWAKTEAVRQLLSYKFDMADFPRETGQKDGTIMHAVERSWIYIAEANGFKSRIIGNDKEIKNGR